MGFYIETGGSVGKAEAIIEKYNAKQVTQDEARKAIAAGKGVICVVKNAWFEAAGFCFDDNEFGQFTEPDDHRPRTWLVMDRHEAEKASGFIHED